MLNSKVFRGIGGKEKASLKGYVVYSDIEVILQLPSAWISGHNMSMRMGIAIALVHVDVLARTLRALKSSNLNVLSRSSPGRSKSSRVIVASVGVCRQA